MKNLLTLVCGFVLLPVFAFAQTTDAATTIDLADGVDVVLQITMTILLAVAPIIAAWLATKANKLLGLSIDEKQRAVAEHAFETAIRYGLTLVRQKANAADLTIDLKHEAIAKGVTYALSRYPEAMKHFGLDANSVAKALTARLDAALTDKSA